MRMARLDCHLGCTHGLSRGCGQNADGARTDDRHTGVGAHPAGVAAVPGDGRRLDERRIGKAQAHGERHQRVAGCDEPLAHATGVEHAQRRRAAFTEVVVALLTTRARTAAEDRLDCYGCPVTEHAGEFVPCYLGATEAQVVEVRRADARHGHPHQLALALRLVDIDDLHTRWRVPHCFQGASSCALLRCSLAPYS